MKHLGDQKSSRGGVITDFLRLKPVTHEPWLQKLDQESPYQITLPGDSLSTTAPSWTSC